MAWKRKHTTKHDIWQSWLHMLRLFLHTTNHVTWQGWLHMQRLFLPTTKRDTWQSWHHMWRLKKQTSACHYVVINIMRQMWLHPTQIRRCLQVWWVLEFSLVLSYPKYVDVVLKKEEVETLKLVKGVSMPACTMYLKDELYTFHPLTSDRSVRSHSANTASTCLPWSCSSHFKSSAEGSFSLGHVEHFQKRWH